MVREHTMLPDWLRWKIELKLIHVAPARSAQG
jgi:hypothetical protein